MARRMLLQQLRDAGLSGVTSEEVLQLDAATRRAEVDLKDIVDILDADTKEHKAFLAVMRKMSAVEAARRLREN